MDHGRETWIMVSRRLPGEPKASVCSSNLSAPLGGQGEERSSPAPATGLPFTDGGGGLLPP